MAEAQQNNSPAEAEVVIRIRGLLTRFGFTTIHENLDLDVRRGEIIGIVGGSGTGKSVMLKTIIGLKRPEGGVIEIFGKDQAKLSDKERESERRRWGVLFQDGALFSSLTVAQNVQVPLRKHYKLSQKLMDEIAALKISLSGLRPDAGPKFPSDLSGGMRKRAGLARALALDPQIVFLDEPTAGLDPIGAAAFDQLILQLRDALGLTVFIVTHDMDTLYTICDRIAVLSEKRVIATEPVEVLEKLDHPWVQEYFGGPRARAAQQTKRNNAKKGS